MLAKKRSAFTGELGHPLRQDNYWIKVVMKPLGPCLVSDYAEGKPASALEVFELWHFCINQQYLSCVF